MFVFKQRAAFVMRISDWSSDVCSSDLIPGTTGHVAVTKELAITNNAAVTTSGSPGVYAEDVAKAESILTFENEDLRLPVIAHFLKASNQILADAPRLRGMIDTRLRYGLKVRADAEIVSTLTTSGNFTALDRKSTRLNSSH